MGLGLGIRIADLNLQPNTVAVLSVFITGGQYTDSLKVVNYILLFVETMWEMAIRRRERYREFGI